MASPRARPQPAEGPDAARRFEGTMDRLLRVSKEELVKREADYQADRRTKKSRTPVSK